MPTGKYTAADLADAPAPKGKYTAADLADAAPAPPPAAPPTMGEYLKNVGIGAARGVASTLGNVDQMVGKIPVIGKALNTPVSSWFDPNGMTADQATAKMVQHGIPQNGMQALGKGIEQAGEFMIPGGAEEKLLGKAPALAKMAGAALGAGAVNKAQGGSFGAGAAAGAVGSGIGSGLKSAAPVLAETALKVRGTDRGFGATPGRAILDETSGLTPGKVVATGRESANAIDAQRSQILGNAASPVDLTPTRQVAGSFVDKALDEGHRGTIKDLSTLSDQIHTDYSGQTIPSQVSAVRAAALNRGISNARTSWNPATANDTMNAAAGIMHHTLGKSIEEVAPEVAGLNQRTQSLIPVLARANAADLNAGPLQRMVGRFGAHTGALGIGATVGATTHNPLLGLAALGGTELMASPEAWLGAARAANSPLTSASIVPAMGAAMQFGRKKVVSEPQ